MSGRPSAGRAGRRPARRRRRSAARRAVRPGCAASDARAGAGPPGADAGSLPADASAGVRATLAGADAGGVAGRRASRTGPGVLGAAAGAGRGASAGVDRGGSAGVRATRAAPLPTSAAVLGPPPLSAAGPVPLGAPAPLAGSGREVGDADPQVFDAAAGHGVRPLHVHCLDAVAVRVEQEPAVVVGPVLRARPGRPSSRYPASIPACQKASTAARLGAGNPTCRPRVTGCSRSVGPMAQSSHSTSPASAWLGSTPSAERTVR